MTYANILCILSLVTITATLTHSVPCSFFASPVISHFIHCVQKKTPTHIFFHISMNDEWILTKIAANIPKERQILTM